VGTGTEQVSSVRTSQLESGLRLVTDELLDAASVAVGFWVAVGSRDETVSQGGVSHFLEHLLFKGTPRRSAKHIAEAVDAVGGDMNAYTTKEHTTFYVRLLADDLELALDIMCDIMSDPSLASEDVESERTVIIDELRSHLDEPSELLGEILYSALFPDHPLGREVLGEMDTIASLTQEQIRAFYEDYYHPSHLVAAVAGRVEHERVLEGIQARSALFEERAARGKGKAIHRSSPSLPPRPLSVLSRQTEQAHVAIGFRAPDYHDERRWALSMFNQVLGGGVSSRLFQEVREKRGLAYSVWSERSSFQDTGSLAAIASTSPAQARFVVELMLEEMDKLVSSGISQRELEVARGHLRANTLLSMEDSGSRMGRLGSHMLAHGKVIPVEEVLSHIESATMEDVMAIGQEVLAGPRVLAVVGPFEDSDMKDLAEEPT